MVRCSFDIDEGQGGMGLERTEILVVLLLAPFLVGLLSWRYVGSIM